MLTENNVKAELSVAYVMAVAAKVKFACEITSHDFDSVDITVTSNGKLADDSIFNSPEIKLQLKSTINLEDSDDTNFKFVLPIKNYNDLRAHTMTPRLLVVLSLPDDEESWLNHSIDSLILKNCAYWVNLAGSPDSQNSSDITVYMPKQNVFSPEALMDLMVKASKQEKL